MKLFKIKYLAGGLLVLTLASCKKDVLDKFPTSNIALDQSFESIRDARSWNTGLYSNLRGRFYGVYTYTQDIQADQLNASIDFGNRNGFPQRWEGFEATEGNINAIWTGYYRGITNANIMIKGFDNITPNGATETADLSRYKGDAYAVRAYYHHELVRRYAKPYEPATAAGDAGVPVILEYDVFSKPSRASVKAVYDQVISDINQAKTLLAGVTGAQGSIRFTIDAVNALEARVRLDMQDWAGAKTAADAVIATGKYPLINTQTAHTAYWHTDTKQEDIMQLYVANTTETPSTNAIYLGLNTSINKFRPDFVPSQWVIDKYPATDIRKATYFASKAVDFTTGSGTLTLVNKYPGNPALFTGANTNYQHAPKFLRIAEMYLISAEAGARGTADADALVKLNALRTARGLTTLSALADNALFSEVKEERFRELAFEGFRLWDLKRWHEGFTRSAPQNTNFLSTGTGYTTLTIAADHPKFAWGLPSNDITINPNVQQNPGW
jgi:hypothetical protein